MEGQVNSLGRYGRRIDNESNKDYRDDNGNPQSHGTGLIRIDFGWETSSDEASRTMRIFICRSDLKQDQILMVS